LTYSDFEVVDLTPVVTSISATGGVPGDQMTVVGHNFSGAGGRLQVMFGNTPATSVTIQNDNHITLTVPDGSGTVPVTVVSGVSDAGDTGNYTGDVWGYGTATATDQFTYVPGSDQPPTVAVAASSSPARATGRTTTLTVLGADDGGEANLTYVWSVLSGPAAVTFGANGSNAAKNIPVAFQTAGSYQFQVTITDPSGQSVTSTVNVEVAQALASIQLAPRSVRLGLGGRVRFKALAFDQFGQVVVHQPLFRWLLIGGYGTINQTGLFTASRLHRGKTTIQVRAAAARNTAVVWVR
jgi:hypothetical protein